MTNAAQLIAEQFWTPEMRALAADLISLVNKPEIKRDALYTWSEVATLTEVSVRTLQNAAKNERLKVDYIGSEPRIRGAAILQWLDEGGKTGRSKRDLLREAT
jgi:hypothetical protein